MIVNGLKPRRRRDASAASTVCKTVAPRVSGAASATRAWPWGPSASVAPSSAARTSARSPSLMGTRYPNSVMVSETIFVLGEAKSAHARRFSKLKIMWRNVETSCSCMAICSGVSPSRLTTG